MNRTIIRRLGSSHRVRRAAWLSAAAGGVFPLLMLAGCSGKQKQLVVAEPPARAYQPPPRYDGSARPVTEVIPSHEPGIVGPVLIGQQRLSGRVEGAEGVAPTVLESQPGELVKVELALKSADFSDILRLLIGDYLNRNFVIDPKVQGQVTLEIDGEFTKGEIIALIGHLGSMYGWFVEEREGVMFVRAMDKLVRAADAPILQAAPAIADDQPAVRVKRLRYIAADQASSVLKELISDNAKAMVAGRTLVIADTTRQIARLSRLLTALDTPAFEGVEVWTYRLSHRRPEEAQRVLEQIATGTGINAGADSSIAFVPVPGTQRLLVVAKDATLHPSVRELLRQIDQPADGERRQRYVYRVQHYPQAALVKLLTDFFADRIEAVAGAAAAAAGDAGPRIRLVSDPQSDLLLIHSTANDYADLLATLRAVDRAPQQVVVQSIIAEVRLTRNLEYGVEYFLSGSNSLGDIELTGSVPIGNPLLATGGAFFLAGDGFAVIRALDRESEARILSQPKIVISDRAKGSIQVGGEVPVLKAQQGTGSGASDIREEIEYRETGVILTIEPAISENGTVTLKIVQEVSAALPTSVPNQPEFTTRKIETVVTVPSGRTVLLGGIINRDDRKNADRIPLLGRVPVLGEAFSNKENTTERSELLLTITPTILNDPAELSAAMNDFMQCVESVRAALLEAAESLPAGSLRGLDTALPLNPEPEPAGGDPGAS